MEAIARRLDAIASRLEAIASRLEAIAGRLEAIASRLEAIASKLEAIDVFHVQPPRGMIEPTDESIDLVTTKQILWLALYFTAR